MQMVLITLPLVVCQLRSTYKSIMLLFWCQGITNVVVSWLFRYETEFIGIFQNKNRLWNIGWRRCSSTSFRIEYQYTLQWRHNGRDGVWNHQPQHCLLNRLFRRRSKKTSTLRVTGLCAGSSPVTGVFPAQMASNAENVSIWWRHHEYLDSDYLIIHVLT